MKSEKWYKVLESVSEIPDSRVKVVTAGHKSICLTNYEGKISALDNKCPHQSGPLGEGSIENGYLRCPWHGWDFHPCTGKPPGGYDDGVKTYAVEIRDNAVFVCIEEETEENFTVSDIMVKTMINWGVTQVFGMVGHSNLGLADAFRKQEEKGNLKFIAVRHEGAASFAASAYGKLTGRPAACFAIAGPGSTNMFTGLWDARVDRAPLLALTGQVNTQVVGTGAFQEIDLKKAFEPVAEFNHTVMANSKHTELMSLAIKHALLQRNVSHLTFPDEVQVQLIEKEEEPGTPDGRITQQQIAPPEDQLNKAVYLLQNSKRPVIIVGHGAKGKMQNIIKLAEKLNAPVITTFKGKGLIPDAHMLAGGVLGRSGTPIASWFMNESDLLCVFGASFSNHTGITSKKPIIQVDFDALAIAKFHAVEAPVWGEIGVTTNLILQKIGNKLQSVNQKPEIKQRWEIWKKEKEKRLRDISEKGLSSIAVFDAMSQFVPENAVITVDVGNNAYSFGRYFEPKNQSILMSGYLGSIGFAYPAAIGAWAAASERPIVAVSGDGGFVQYLGELTTAVKYNIPIKHILLNNSELGKISKEQRAAEFDVWKTGLHNPNFSEFAKNCGALGIRVEKRAELEKAMQKVFKHQGPAMLEIITDVNLI